MLLSPPCWQVSTFFAEAISIITWILPVWRAGPGSSKLCLKMHIELVGKAGGTPSHPLQVLRTLCILPEKIYFFSRVLQASKISPAHQLGAFSRDSGFISPTCWIPCLFSSFTPRPQFLPACLAFTPLRCLSAETMLPVTPIPVN